MNQPLHQPSRSSAPTPRRKARSAAMLLAQARRSVTRANAEYLLMHVLQVPRHQLYLGQPISARTAARFRRLVLRTGRGEPVQYLTGRAPFLDFEVKVDRRVLIPRPETEELVARTLAMLQSGREGRNPKARMMAVDFGTGTGCIAIAVARAFPQLQVLAVDTSKAALDVARNNVARLGLGGRVQLAQAGTLGDNALARLRGRLDLFISNPPYLPTSRLARLDPAVRREPRLALDGGPKGASIVAMLLAQGPSLLKPGGLLAMEIDATHRHVVRSLAPGAKIERDLAGRIRYAFLTR